MRRAITKEHVHDLALEIGRHPALKGPASEIIKSITGCELPYSGVLRRGQSALESFVDAHRLHLGQVYLSKATRRLLMACNPRSGEIEGEHLLYSKAFHPTARTTKRSIGTSPGSEPYPSWRLSCGPAG